MPKIITYVKIINAKARYVWHTDDIMGDMISKEACVATVMDGSSKFCLVMVMMAFPSKDGQNSKELFEEAGKMAGHAPLITISDGLAAGCWLLAVTHNGHKGSFWKKRLLDPHQGRTHPESNKEQ